MAVVQRVCKVTITCLANTPRSIADSNRPPVEDQPPPSSPSNTYHGRYSPEPVSVLTCVSLQYDATVMCWGWNNHGQLGLDDTANRGDGANGPCPTSFTTPYLVPAPRVLTLAAALRVQRWGRIFLRSTWGVGGRP